MKTLKMYKNKIGMNRKVEEMLKKIKNIPKKILIPIVIVGILGISTTIILSNSLVSCISLHFMFE